MDTFALARAKHAKNMERRARTEAITPESILEEVELVPELPKEKGLNTSAIIEVRVTLPNGEFSFTLVKPAVFQNANQSRLTKNEFINRIKSGLEPLLGALR